MAERRSHAGIAGGGVGFLRGREVHRLRWEWEEGLLLPAQLGSQSMGSTDQCVEDWFAEGQFQSLARKPSGQQFGSGCAERSLSAMTPGPELTVRSWQWDVEGDPGA